METIFSEKNEPSALCVCHGKRRWFVAAATLTVVKYLSYLQQLKKKKFKKTQQNKKQPVEKEKCDFLDENMRNCDNAVSY